MPMVTGIQRPACRTLRATHYKDRRLMDAARALPRSAHRRQWPIVLAVLLLAPPLLFIAACSGRGRTAAARAGNSRVIVNARVVDVAGQASEPTTVTVRNGTITAIGEDPPTRVAGSTPAAAGCCPASGTCTPTHCNCRRSCSSR
jgi:hypothetical protein